MIEAVTANGRMTLRVRALPLPASLAGALSENADLLRAAVDTAERQRDGGSRKLDSGKPTVSAEPSCGEANAGGATAAPDDDREGGAATAANGEANGSHSSSDALVALQKRCAPPSWSFRWCQTIV